MGSSEGKIRALIVDDEAPARARIRHFLQTEKDFQLVGECANGNQAVASIQSERPDVVFLDVQMPRLDGFGVCETVGVEQMPLVIFTTAYDQYALRAFDVHAVDYLLKPFDRARFQKTLRHVRERLQHAEPAASRPDLKALLQELRASFHTAERLAIKTQGKMLFLRFEDVDWVEAEGNYICLHVGPAAHLVRETMSWCEAHLPPRQFLRISRSAIVNTARIKEIQPLFYGDSVVILSNGTRLTLSRNYRDRLESFLP